MARDPQDDDALMMGMEASDEAEEEDGACDQAEYHERCEHCEQSCDCDERT